MPSADCNRVCRLAASPGATHLHDRSRTSRQRPPPRHRGDAARAVGERRRLADARVAARDRAEHGGIAHFVEHMLFKGTTTRTAEDIAQAIDSIGGQLDAFTVEGIRRLLHQGARRAPAAGGRRARRTSSCSPAFARRRHRAREEGDPRRDQDGRGHARRSRPRAVHRRRSGQDHPLGRPILGTPETVEAFTQAGAARLLRATPTSRRTSSSRRRATSSTSASRDLVERAFARCRRRRRRSTDAPPPSCRSLLIAREGARAEPHLPRDAGATRRTTPIATSRYVLNTLLGGSMSSRLFQNIREKRGLAYAVFSGLAPTATPGMLTIYAGCANEAVAEVIDLVVEELRGIKREPRAARRAAARQGPPQGQPDAVPREHVEPDVAPGAPGDLLRSARSRLDETLAAIERGHRRRRAARGQRSLQRRVAGGDRARAAAVDRARLDVTA